MLVLDPAGDVLCSETDGEKQPRGLKPKTQLAPCAARLKSCPDLSSEAVVYYGARPPFHGTQRGFFP